MAAPVLIDVLRPTRPTPASSASVVAVVSALVCAPVAVLLVQYRAVDPRTSQGVVAPIAYAFVTLVVLGALALLVHRPWVAGLTLGGIVTWVTAAVAAPLVGTPYGYGSMGGDAGRMSALATYFATTARPSDAADPALPPEYPPLYPMIAGRVAAVTGKEAWLVLAPMQIFLMGLAVLVAFCLWQRLVPAVLAIPLALAALAGLAEPSKGNEVLVLAAFLPLLLATFAPPPGTRPLHPLVAGAAFGIMVPLYPNFLILGLLGIGMILVRGWLVAADRARFLAHAVVTVVVAAVLASWYLGPLLAAYVGGDTEVVADLFRSASLTNQQFILFPSRSVLITALQVLGLAGILVSWRSTWWAAPLGLLAAGILVVKAAMLLRYSGGEGHSFMLLYTPYVLGYLFAAAGLLTLGEVARQAGPWLVARTSASPRVLVVGGVAALCGVFAAPSYMDAWAVQPRGFLDTNGVSRGPAPVSLSAYAHTEYIPDFRKPDVPWPTMTPGFPARAVDAAIRETSDAEHPVVLSADQRLFSYVWYPNWLPPKRASSNALTRWDSRFAWLRSVAGTPGSRALADALADTPFGPVDVLVLPEGEEGYRFLGLEFSEAALTGEGFTATTGLPGRWAVFVRR